MFKAPLIFAIYSLVALTQMGCQWAEPLYVGTHWTRGTWTGADRTIEMVTRETPSERAFATALQIENGPLWTRPAHPDELAYNVVGWNAVLSDEEGRILPPETFPDGAKVRVRGLMRTAAGVVDGQGRVLHTLDDEERNRGVFTIEVEEMVMEAPPPPTTRPTTIETTIPPLLSRGMGGEPQFLLLLSDPHPPATVATTSPTSAPGLQPAMKLIAKVVSHDRIDLTWTPVPGAAKYRLEMAHEDREFFDSVSLDAGEARAINRDLSPERQYYFRVTALSAEGDILAGSNVGGGRTKTAPRREGPIVLPPAPAD